MIHDLTIFPSYFLTVFLFPEDVTDKKYVMSTASSAENDDDDDVVDVAVQFGSRRLTNKKYVLFVDMTYIRWAMSD